MALNYDKETIDRIIEDMINSKTPNEMDSIPDAYPDYEDLNSVNELRRKRRSIPSGLEVRTLSKPDSCDRVASNGDILSIHYECTFGPGGKLDTSYDRDEPLKFQLGVGQVINGWEQGTVGMCVGEKRKLIVPPELGYGDQGAGDVVPGGVMLYFTIELINIEEGPIPVNVF